MLYLRAEPSGTPHFTTVATSHSPIQMVTEKWRKPLYEPSDCAGRTIIVGFILIVLIICVSVFAASFKKVDEGEACVKINTRTGTIDPKPQTSAKNVILGPDFAWKCVPTTRQAISMSGNSSGWETRRQLSARTIEGLDIALDIDVEYIIDGSAVYELIRKFGDEWASAYNIIARSSLRNVASEFEGLQYLRGERGTISDRMREVLDVRFREDHATVERVNLRDIFLDLTFEAAFRGVEEVRLNSREALENRTLAIVNEQRQNETQVIELKTARQKVIVEANAKVTQAELGRSAGLTTARTTAERLLIAEESTRQAALIAAQGNVSKALAQRDAAITDARRQTRELELIAERERDVALISARSKVQEALEQREGQVEKKMAEIDALERELESLLVSAAAEAVQVLARNNVTVQGIVASGQARVAEVQSRRVAQKQMFDALGSAAGIGKEEALQYLWTKALEELTTANQTTAFLDYAKQPLMVETGALGGTVVGASVGSGG